MTTELCKEMKRNQYIENHELYSNPYQNNSTGNNPYNSEIYSKVDHERNVLHPHLHAPLSYVVHNPHAIKLKRSCHNTKCRYCFPNASNNNPFDLESHSSSSESASQIMTRSALNNHSNYKKFLGLNKRPTCIIHEETTVNDSRQDVINGGQVKIRQENEIPVFKEVRTSTPLVNHTTLPNRTNNYIPNLIKNNYHLEDHQEVYWSEQETPFTVYSNASINTNSNHNSIVVTGRQAGLFNQKNPNRVIQNESIATPTNTTETSMTTNVSIENEMLSKTTTNNLYKKEGNTFLQKIFKKPQSTIIEENNKLRLRLTSLTNSPENNQSIPCTEITTTPYSLNMHDLQKHNNHNHDPDRDDLSVIFAIYKSQIISNDGNFSAPKRAMSHTNVYGPRSWNLRSYQGSESDLAYKREMLSSSSSSRLARSGYSARRERLKQEREQELLRQTRLRQMAASSTGLHDHRHYQQSNIQQQHYRSTSAVNRSMGNTEAFEEFETITLQPIGRGVQDLDSHVGSMTTLARGGGASSMIEVHKHTFRTPRMYSPTSYHFNRAHSTTPTRYSRPTKGFSNGLYKSHSAYSGSVETCPMFKSHTPDPGRDITGSPLWTALPRNSSTTPTICKTWRSERNITTTPLGQITYEDVMPNTQMAKIQVLESSELPTTFSPYSRKSASLQPNEVVKKDIRVFESPSDNAILNNYLDIHESEMTNLKRVVSLRKPPERSRLWALPDNMKILRSSDGFMADSCYPNDVDIDENEELINHQFNLPEPGKTTLKTEINGLSRIDDHQPPRASSRTSLSRQPFDSTQYLNKQNYNHDGEQTIFINRVQPTSSTPVQSYPPSRLGTQSVYSDHITVSTTPQTVTAPTKVVSNLNVLTNTRKTSELTEVPMQNGWKSEKPKQDTVDSGNMPQVIATARVWYQPKLSREEAISILRQQVPGSFLIRDSTTYKDAFGLAVKVATLPPKVTPKSNDLQSELVRHYLIEAVNTPTKGVRLKGFASEPVFPSLAALINRHTQDALALPCRLILPAIPTTPLPHGYKPPPQIVTGLPPNTTDTTISNHISQSNNQYISKVDSATGPVSELGSVIMDNVEIDCTKSVTNTSTMGIEGLPFECVIKDEHHKPVMSQCLLNQGMTYRCFMLGSVDTPQWNNELCFSRAVDQLIPLETLTASECDHGISRVRYSDIQLHVSAHDGITIIDLLRRLFLRRHLPNNILLYCGIETRKKEFIHPEHQNHGIRNPKIFGLVVRKGISECTCHIFSECDPVHSAESIVNYIRTIYPHLKS
uniref:Tensin-3 n=1 Tax=Schistosoma haematobium TaxID=6185 RepID=A0A094ZWL7_SCHHA